MMVALTLSYTLPYHILPDTLYHLQIALHNA